MGCFFVWKSALHLLHHGSMLLWTAEGNAAIKLRLLCCNNCRVLFNFHYFRLSYTFAFHGVARPLSLSL